MKRSVTTALLLGCVLVSLSAQSAITRFAVVDLNRITSAFSEQSVEFKAFNEKLSQFQAEMNRRSEELKELDVRLDEARQQGKQDQIRTLENQITTRRQAAKDYIEKMQAELEKDRDRLQRSNSFMSQVVNAVRVIAESEGYSMVLSKEGAGIIWNSPSVDITNKVIERLRSGGKR